MLLATATDQPANVTVTFLREGGLPPHVYPTTVKANSRDNVWTYLIPELANSSFAMVVDSDIPVIAERAMYFPGFANPMPGKRLFEGGHESAGVAEQAAPKRFIRVRRPVEVREGDKWARLEPHFGYRLEFSIEFGHPAIDATGQRYEIDFATTSYVREIARARTFGFMQDVEALRSVGLAQGGSLDNAIVMDEYRVLNSDGLRYDEEFVRHKILDAIGDLYLVGHPLLAAYKANKSGHALNNRLLRELLAHEDAWEIATFGERREAPRMFAFDWSPA